MTQRTLRKISIPERKTRKNSISPWDDDEMPQSSSPLKKYLLSQKNQTQQQKIKLNLEYGEKSRQQAVKKFLPKFNFRIKTPQMKVDDQNNSLIQILNKTKNQQDIQTQGDTIKYQSERKISACIFNQDKTQNSTQFQCQKSRNKENLVKNLEQTNFISSQIYDIKQLFERFNKKSAENTPISFKKQNKKELIPIKRLSNHIVLPIQPSHFLNQSGIFTPVVLNQKKNFIKRSWKSRLRTVSRT